MEDPADCYEEDQTYEHECPHCGKTFVFSVGYIRVYSEKKADCRNGGEHEYEPPMTWPPQYLLMRCKNCDDIRPCTAEEGEQILNGLWKFQTDS